MISCSKQTGKQKILKIIENVLLKKFKNFPSISGR
jgi:hypothetical protein